MSFYLDESLSIEVTALLNNENLTSKEKETIQNLVDTIESLNDSVISLECEVRDLEGEIFDQEGIIEGSLPIDDIDILKSIHTSSIVDTSIICDNCKVHWPCQTATLLNISPIWN